MFTDCPGCAERREKMKATMAALVGWVTRASPASAPPPTSGTAKDSGCSDIGATATPGSKVRHRVVVVQFGDRQAAQSFVFNH